MASEIYDKTKNMLGAIGAAQTLIEEFPLQFNFFDDLKFSTSFDVIAILFKELGITKEEVVEIITKALCGSLEPDSDGKGFLSKLEQIVKMALEANIINILNCSTNPIISNDLMDRYFEDDIEYTGSGISVNISELDFTGVLRRNPFGKTDSKFYFDTEQYNPNTVYKSKDFNAYLWYIINKSDVGHIEERIWDNRYPVKEGKVPKSIITCKYVDDGQTNNEKIKVYICADTYHQKRELKLKNKTWKVNKTLFEFNHDFISSIKLYEPKVIVSEIIEYFFGNGGFVVNLGLSMNEKIIEGKVQQIIKNIIEGNDLEINDCYFTFSNEEYNEMLERSEEYRLSPDNLFQNLENITSTSTLEENKTIINQTLTDLTVTPAQDPSGVASLDLDYDWHNEIIRMLIYPLIRPLFTPKIIFLLLVNQKIMGSLEDIDKLDFNETLEKLINTIIKHIKPIIIELIKMLIQIYLEPIIKKLEEIVQIMGTLLIMETLLLYKQQLENIYKACFIGWNSAYLNGAIDEVNYADIIPTQVEPEQNIC